MLKAMYEVNSKVLVNKLYLDENFVTDWNSTEPKKILEKYIKVALHL
jgi:hypothetical protein